jgi:hypothetical protein
MIFKGQPWEQKMKNYNTLKLSGLIILLALFTHTLPLGIFEPGFHMPKLVVNTIKNDQEEKIGHFKVNACRTLATSSYDPFDNQTGLFGGYGPIDFGVFAGEQLTVSKSSIANIYDKFPKTKNLQTSLASLAPGANTTKLVCHGKAESYEFDVSFQQFFLEGFFIKANVPFQFIDVGDLTFQNQFGETDAFTTQVNSSIDEVLEEHSFATLNSGGLSRGMSDILAGVGWAASRDAQSEYVRAISGTTEIGVVLPMSTISEPEEKDNLFSIPLGNKGHFGTYANCGVAVDLEPNITIGGNASCQAFFTNFHTMRLKHNPYVDQLHFFHREEVELALGSKWEASAYLKAGIKKSGINIVFGYSYASQEKSTIFLAESVKEKKLGFYDINKLNSLDASTNDSKLTIEDRKNLNFMALSDSIINTDNRLKRSYYHVLHLSIIIQPEQGESEIERPCFKASYNYPIYGKSSFLNKGFDGSIDFAFSFSF